MYYNKQQKAEQQKQNEELAQNFSNRLHDCDKCQKIAEILDSKLPNKQKLTKIKRLFY
ncbi:hypothetical protein AAEX28_07230 [Lentisphaerota bacterium WC36G]|nr:hypothetical protein LJT99_10095 [Lentisphaerae bacterium WC36]UDQ99310.1 hypothetical protein LJT99_07170 [Lentisphaerae bacterium WC36]